MTVQVATSDRSSDELVGQVLASRYLIEHKLGEGAMGTVYRARHVKMGRPFAVKVLHPKLLEDEKLALRFAREAELAGRLHHPNVIGVVDVGETPEGHRYMVMDFAAGGDLADLLGEAPMPPARIIHLVRQMLEGLYHAHEAGLIHRDFKPENVIVERDDHGNEVPRIVDFGISILRDGGEAADATGRLTTNGLVLGTPHYMAPEQAVADPIDHRIDLFAMGIVVYEMLCGRLPFDGAGAEVARANLLLDPPPISQRVPHLEVDPLLEAYARHLMAKNRDRRPATAKRARELLDLIERDRAAAAAALGLAPATGTWGPLATQPLPSEPVPPVPRPTHEAAPVKRAATGGGRRQQGAPPGGPRPSALTPRPTAPALRPSAPELLSAPEPARRTPYPRAATPSGAGAPARAPTGGSTWMADPLPWAEEPAPSRSRRRWLIAGGVGLAGAGVIIAAALAIRGGGGGQKQPAEEQVATIAPTGPSPAPAPTPTAAPAPAPPASPVADPPVADSAPTKIDPAPEPPATNPGPGPRKPVKDIHPPKKGPSIKPGGGPTRTSPEVAKPDASPVPDRAEPPKIPIESPASSRDNQKLFADYQQVNSELVALEKALGSAVTQDLWVIYRYVSYNAAIENDAKRQMLIANLAKIRDEIAKRKKR